MLFVVKLRDEPHALVRAARAETREDLLVFYDRDESPLMTFPTRHVRKIVTVSRESTAVPPSGRQSAP